MDQNPSEDFTNFQVLEQDLQVKTPELLRAAPLHLLLRRSGEVLRQSAGTSQTFDLSVPIETIKWFVSHSWQTAGWLKTVALLYRSNARAAFSAWIVSLSVFYALKLSHPDAWQWQVVRFHIGGGGQINVIPIDAMSLVCCIILIVVLLYWQEVRPSRYAPTCFLDKCCIHQTDQAKKQQGIEQLGGFLSRSEKMIILWQPEYLTRLWCVYELAAFTYIKQELSKSIELIPLKLPLLVVTFLAFHLAASAMFLFLAPYTILSESFAEFQMENGRWSSLALYFGISFGLYALGTYPILSLPLWRFCTHHIEDRFNIVQQLRTFSVQEAHCFMQSDRSFVVSRIEMWFANVANFESMVQQEVQQQIQSQLDSAGLLPFKYVLFGSLPHFCFGIGPVLQACRDGDWDMASRDIMLMLAAAGCCDAICIGLSLRLALRERANPASFTYRYGGAVYVVLLFSFFSTIPPILVSPAMPLWADFVVASLLVALTFALYRPFRPTPPPDPEAVAARISSFRSESIRSMSSKCSDGATTVDTSADLDSFTI